MRANIQLIDSVAELLVDQRLTLATAESCTGGMITAELTSVPGCTAWLEGGFVTYRVSAKLRMLGVRQQTLDAFGAVSEPTAREMAEGALSRSDAGISVSVTGIAGPDGGDVLSPVGTVWFGWAMKTPAPQCVQTARHELTGGRESVREQAVDIALTGLLNILRDR